MENTLAKILERAADACDATRSFGTGVAIENLARVLADDSELTASLEKRMAAKLIERAKEN